jgi:hypothetical protein
MSALLHQRCWHHGAREAVVRCPDCHRFFCRECVIEHQGRMICTACVNASEVQTGDASRIGTWTLLGVGGFLLAWCVFYYLGMFLARIPSDFFESA